MARWEVFAFLSLSPSALVSLKVWILGASWENASSEWGKLEALLVMDALLHLPFSAMCI